MKLINIIVSQIFLLMLFTGLFFFFYMGLNRTYNNIKNINNFKKGLIQSSQIIRYETFNGSDITNRSVIKILNENLLLESNNYFEAQKGDTVNLRYVGTKENNIIFEANGKKVGSPYDWFDYFSPFMVMFFGFLIYWIYLAKYIDRFKKRRFKTFLVFFATISTTYSQSQPFDVQCSATPYLSFEANSFKTHNYEPSFKVSKIYKNLSEVKNEFPEQLIESEMSVISQEWSSYNYGKSRKAEPSRYESIKKMNVEKNYSNLLYKLQYTINGEEFAIIKFDIFSENKPTPTGYALGMKKIQNRWVIYDEAAMADLMFFIMFLKTETLEAIFNKKPTGNKKLDEIILSSTLNDKFNLNQCVFLVKTTLENNKASLENILDPNRLFK